MTELSSIVRLTLRIGLFTVVTGTIVAAQSPEPPRYGYLFIDGEYIEPPYDVSRSQTAIFINGKKLDRNYFRQPLLSYEAGEPTLRNDRQASKQTRSPKQNRAQQDRSQQANKQGRGEATNARRVQEATAMRRAYQQAETIKHDAIVVLSRKNAPLVIFPGDVSYRLLTSLKREGGPIAPPPSHFGKAEQVSWNRVIADFEPSEPFLSRFASDLADYEVADKNATRISEANRLVAQISYPMTVFAMGAIVVAFGHLLSTRPTWDVDSEDSTDILPVNKSLVMMAVFSALDLVWTLAATEAGTMRELNPLGSRLIEDPSMLVAFKIVVTGTSIGILYKLHRRPIAQVASWWCCLVLMLLTARWVVFQSMFT